MNALKGGLAKLGIIKSIEKISDHKDISMNEELYNNIDIWKDLYKGYHEPFHKIKYHTIEGQKERKMDTLMMAKTVSAEMASLVFNEKCEISISDESLSEFIDDVFKKNKFYKKYQDHLEYNFAMGGAVVKPYVKDDKMMLSFVTADCFIPLAWNNDTITEAVFPSEFKKNNKKYTHLEWHVWEGSTYLIKNEVYESSGGDDLGVKVALENFFPGLEEEVRITALSKPIFSYIKPNTANNVDTQSPLGISIYANAMDTMKAIDTAFDSFHREFRLGKKRIIVPAQMVKTVVDNETGQMHRYFDASDETYEAFKYREDEENIKDISVELRVDEHIAGINALLNLFAMQTGFSAGTFSFDGQSVKTATEVVSENSKTFKSKKSHETIIEAGLQEVIESIVAVAQLYGLYKAPADYEVTVTFDDSIVEDNAAEQSRQIQLITNKLQSRKRAIMNIHGLGDDEALELIKEINEENATANAESVDFFGTGNNNGGGN
ncbi:phage portal protein, putative, A118 family [Virgibacillus subterraneus]|uniref:Phage portal protein, putative, A118 family n=2 Tax=Virgibacillus subterraneus TaxID=621109 RepID=A0A1H8Z0A5_9BACI|nr:phage portal protein, putative, A118 family [Virgibacillus subterraneus]